MSVYGSIVRNRRTARRAGLQAARLSELTWDAHDRAAWRDAYASALRVAIARDVKRSRFVYRPAADVLETEAALSLAWNGGIS